MTKTTEYRWTVKIKLYDNTEITKQFDEFYDTDAENLTDIIELGPNWHDIKEIVITYNRRDGD